MRVLAATGLAGLMLVATAAAAQRDPSAEAVLNRAINVHQTAGSKLRATISYAGEGPVASQSPSFEKPQPDYPHIRTLAIDEQNDRYAITETTGIAGMLLNRRLVKNGDTNHVEDLDTERFNQGALPGSVVLTIIPHDRMRQIKRDAKSLSLRKGSDGQTAIDFVMPDDSRGSLTFDNGSGRLRTFERRLPFSLGGTQRLDIIYPGYRSVDGTLVPEGYTVTSDSPAYGLQETRVLLKSIDTAVDATEFDRRLNLTPLDTTGRPAAFSVDTIAPAVHLVTNVSDSKDQWTYNMLAVEFADFILLGEAPLTPEVARKAANAASAAAKGKPVRYLVLSHQHDDHISGTRGLSDPATTLLMTAQTAEFSKRLDAGGLGLGAFGGSKVVDKREIIADDFNRAEIHQIGPTSHSNEMLVVYLPRQKVLFQADLVNHGSFPVNGMSKALVDWVIKSGLEVETVAGVHGDTIAFAELRERVSQSTRNL